jgi:hypothetical protein
MRESRTYGSVRGALSNERPYRDRSVPTKFAIEQEWWARRNAPLPTLRRLILVIASEAKQSIAPHVETWIASLRSQ